MVSECPICGTKSNSDDYDIDWVFLCKGLCTWLLVWRDDGDEGLRLEIAPGEEEEHA